LIQLWGQEDREPTGKGELELIDAESGTHAKIVLDDRARREYTQAFDTHANELKRLANRNGGRYAGLSTRNPIEEIVFGPLFALSRIH
jgi:hypothetical protein